MVSTSASAEVGAVSSCYGGDNGWVGKPGGEISVGKSFTEGGAGLTLPV